MSSVSFLKKQAVLVPILVLAAFLRTHKTGDEFFGGDDAYISIKAIQIARYGETHLLGPPSSVGLVHSPLSVYLYAIPYLFSPHPRNAQIFTGLMNTFAVGLVYLIGCRYFGRRAAIIASALYAVHPHMVFASRAINNAQLGAPLVMLYIFTGLLGYYENKGWARIVHLPLLSLAGQCHPYTFALAPFSIAIVLHSWVRRPKQRFVITGQTALGAILAALLILPWSIGLYQFSQYVDVLQTIQDIPSPGEQNNDMSYAGLGHIMGLAYEMERVPDNWLRAMQVVITLAGTALLLIKAIQRRTLLPGSAIVLSMILVPLVTWLIQVHWVIDYWWPSLPIAFIVQGAFLGGSTVSVASSDHIANGRSSRNFATSRYFKPAALLLVIALITSHVSDYIYTERAVPPVSLNELVSAMDTAVEHTKEVDKELMVLLAPGHNGLTWAFLREYAFFKHGIKATLVQSAHALPLPDEGAVLVGDANNESRDFLFSSGDIISRRSRMAHLPPSHYFMPDLRLLHPLQFSNGAAVHGFFRQVPESMPTAGEMWSVFMIWQPTQPTPQDFKLFAHLVDKHGHKYAQSDMPGIPAKQWRNGALFASQLGLEIADDLPESGALYLRFGMYNSKSHAQVLDTAGNTTDQSGMIQIRGDRTPLANWPNSLELTQIDVSNPILQGPPIKLHATWYAPQSITGEVRLLWRLLDQNNVQVYDGVTDVVPDFPGSRWSAGMFTSSQYNLHLSPDISPGTYRLELHLVNGQGGISGKPYETSIKIIARNRTFVTSKVPNVVRATFGGEIELLGYDLDKNEMGLEVTLVWQALGYVTRDYKYFVHLWHEEEVAAQVDSMPQDWQYPTSWWVPGEVVSETVVFDVSHLDSTDYKLTTGFYDPADGKRLRVVLPDGYENGDGSVTLREVSHE